MQIKGLESNQRPILSACHVHMVQRGFFVHAIRAQKRANRRNFAQTGAILKSARFRFYFIKFSMLKCVLFSIEPLEIDFRLAATSMCQLGILTWDVLQCFLANTFAAASGWPIVFHPPAR